MEPTSQQIQELRSNFLKKLNENGGEAEIHPKDLEKINKNDEWVRRFLLHHDCNLNESLNMMWDTCQWRKNFGTNDITEDNVRMEYLLDGNFFSHNRDVDGCKLLIFKCKKHVKGQKDFEELKRCVVYWFERLEREVNGKPITVFFDMEGCGLSNMDMEFTKYLINLFKLYYPFFLNYIIIYEMAWILNAAFKIIKSLLPEKAVAKMKFLKKSDVKEYVPMDQALTCWGGQDDYVFSFVPENRPENFTSPTTTSNKKVHFAEGSPMSDGAGPFGDSGDSGSLTVNPVACLSFVDNGGELSSTVVLTNNDEKTPISYKMKTTSPEKFRVRPSAGVLAPGETVSVTLTILPGFQLGGLTRDKFLVMSMPVQQTDMTSAEIAELWKNTGGKQINQHKLRCAQTSLPGEITRNGSVIKSTSNEEFGGMDQNQLSSLTSKILRLTECQSKLHEDVVSLKRLQLISIILIVILAIMTFFVASKNSENSLENGEHDLYKNCPMKA